MFIFDLLNNIINLDSCTDGTGCPSSQFTAIAAAFSTLGYWLQADMLYNLNTTTLGAFPALIYIFAAGGGLVSMAMGQPPKMYLWFFVGPAVFHWLVATPVNRYGVRWNLGHPDSYSTNMEERETHQKVVWKLAETGIINSIWRYQNTKAEVYNDKPPSKTATVALAFDWVDQDLSHLISWLVAWTGVNYMSENKQSASSLPSEIPKAGANNADYNWHLLSNLKWSMLSDATGKSITNPALFEAFITFWASECGDEFARSISKAKYAASRDANGEGMPSSIYDDLNNTKSALRQNSTSSPIAFQSLFNDTDQGSFIRSNQFYKDHPEFNWLTSQNKIKCGAFLVTLMDGLRWEAGHDYFNIIRNAPSGLVASDKITQDVYLKQTEERIVYNLFYGWDLRKSNAAKKGAGERLNLNERKEFLKDIIWIHKLRNALVLAPNRPADSLSASREVNRDANANIAAVQSRSKFAELYVWATMMPYLQGILLYILAGAYPIAAIMMIVPGWHKSIITWFSFFAWAKLWDVGFAVVMVLERSIWSMLGSNSRTSTLFQRIADMQDAGKVIVKFDKCGKALKDVKTCIPEIYTGPGDLEASATAGKELGWNQFLTLFDKAMALANSVDLDLQNGYYIFIMSALYVAVPALTGQFVLGAKSGTSSMVQSMFGGLSGEAGGAAKSGYSGRSGQQMQESQQHRDLENKAVAMRQGPTGAALSGFGVGATWNAPKWDDKGNPIKQAPTPWINGGGAGGGAAAGGGAGRPAGVGAVGNAGGIGGLAAAGGNTSGQVNAGANRQGGLAAQNLTGPTGGPATQTAQMRPPSPLNRVLPLTQNTNPTAPNTGGGGANSNQAFASTTPPGRANAVNGQNGDPRNTSSATNPNHGAAANAMAFGINRESTLGSINSGATAPAGAEPRSATVATANNGGNGSSGQPNTAGIPSIMSPMGASTGMLSGPGGGSSPVLTANSNSNGAAGAGMRSFSEQGAKISPVLMPANSPQSLPGGGTTSGDGKTQGLASAALGASIDGGKGFQETKFRV